MLHSIPDEQEALQALERVGLKDRAKHLPSQLSGGEQQRVCIARALINSPEIILADEPTGALDSKSSRMLLESFNYLNAELEATILMVTHDAFTASYADRVIFMDGGVIVEQGSAEEVIGNPKNERTKAFLQKLQV